MKESTRSRLTVFSRLWAVSLILFIVLCILAVIATMGEKTDMMGIAVVGFCLVFIVQLCQLITAIVVRRWWCAAGAFIGILVSCFVLTCAIVALAAGKYRPPKIIDEAVEEVADTTLQVESVSDTIG